MQCNRNRISHWMLGDGDQDAETEYFIIGQMPATAIHAGSKPIVAYLRDQGVRRRIHV